MPNFRNVGRLYSRLSSVAEFHHRVKTSQYLVAVLVLFLAGRCSAQESLVALPSSEQTFPAPTATGFTAGQPADRSTYTQAAATFPVGDGWTANCWVILNSDWREPRMGVTTLRWLPVKNAVRGASNTFSIAATATTRTIFIGGEARTAFLCGNLGAYASGDASWQFWVSQEGISGEDYQKRVDYFVIQFRIHGAETGDGSGVVINPGGGLKAPDATDSIDTDHWFNDTGYGSVFGSELLRDEMKADQVDEGWTWYANMQAAQQANTGPGTSTDWNMIVPIMGTSSATINMNPANFGAAVGGAAVGGTGAVIPVMQQAVRVFLLLLVYFSSVRRILLLLTVG